MRAIDESSELNASDYKADGKMHKVVVLMNVAKFEMLKNALDKLDITGMTVTQVSGCGIQKEALSFTEALSLNQGFCLR